jgi:hypothetical protein
VVAEALTVFHYVKLCNEIGFADIILEGDAQHIVNVVKTIRQQLEQVWTHCECHQSWVEPNKILENRTCQAKCEFNR